MSPLHLGDLHAAEQALVVLLAVGPFVLLGTVALLRRRADQREAQPGDQRDR